MEYCLRLTTILEDILRKFHLQEAINDCIFNKNAYSSKRGLLEAEA